MKPATRGKSPDLPASFSFSASPLLPVVFAFFWLYGFYASITLNDPTLDAELTGGLCVLYLLLTEVSRIVAPIRFSVAKKSALLALGFLAVLIVCGWRECQDSLINDQLYHVQMALIHAQRLFGPDILPPDSQVATTLLNLPFKFSLYFANFLIIVVATLLFFIGYAPRQRYLRMILSVGSFVFVRTLVAAYVTKGDIHPPLRLAILNGSSLLFGLDAFAFRIPGLIAIALVQCVLVRVFSRHFGTAVAIAAALAIGTAPLLWHVGSMAEPSVWTALGFTLVIWLCDSSLTKEDYKINPTTYLSVYALIALTAVVRQSAFIAAVPVGCYHLADLRHVPRWRQRLRRLLTESSPLWLMIPWTLFIAHTGTPATDRSGTPMAPKIIGALTDGTALRYLYDHLRAPWCALMLLGLIPWRRRGRIALALFVLALLLFYSVARQVWGLARYQAELGIPAATVGVFNALLLLRFLFKNKHQSIYKWSSVCALLALTFWNVATYKDIHDVDGPVDNESFFRRSRDATVRSLAEMSYPFNTALRDIKEQGYSKGLYIDGTVYGLMPQILAGYTLADMYANGGLQPVWEGIDPAFLNQVVTVKSAVFSDWGYAKTQHALSYLQAHGWQLSATYVHWGLHDNKLYWLRRL